MILKLAYKHLVSRPFLTAFTLFGVCAALTVLGVFWTVVENLERVRVSEVSQVSSSPTPGLTLFVDSKAPKNEITDLKTKLRSDKRFAQVEVVESEEALRSLEQQFGQTLGKVFSGDSLPITIKISLVSQSMQRGDFLVLLNEMRSLPNVLDVDDGMNVLPTPTTTVGAGVLSWANALLVIVFAIVALLVSHLIRIGFETLRPEVETMKIMGASKFWIFRPLLLEGVIFGIVGSLVSVVLMTLSVQVFLPRLVSMVFPAGLQLKVLSFSGSLGVMGLGLAASVIGAFFTWPLVSRPAREL